jgi:hypothetical protein
VRDFRSRWQWVRSLHCSVVWRRGFLYWTFYPEDEFNWLRNVASCPPKYTVTSRNAAFFISVFTTILYWAVFCTRRIQSIASHRNENPLPSHLRPASKIPPPKKNKNKNSVASVRRRELYRPTERASGRRLSAKLVPTSADRVCCVVSATNTHGR